MVEISPRLCMVVVGACCLICFFFFFSIKQNPAPVNSRDRPREKGRRLIGDGASSSSGAVIHQATFNLAD